ncbi:DUF3817 domain-containing protein [Lapillicoccus sp.]|uniref:DUF3817 domain-containing protein n=1 Tax=Lapillicoccus sp. TaxID=1909287 RepID=UPI0027BECBB7|nr:DUF3817 domain-containing protein [Actinomycetota bacterium]
MTTPDSPSASDAAAQPTAATIRPDRVRSALRFYQVMAIVAGIALFILIAIIVINRGFGKGGASAVWSPIHGFIYIFYVASIANLGFASRWPLIRMVGNMLTGFVPVLPFIAERRVTRSTRELLARADTLQP